MMNKYIEQFTQQLREAFEIGHNTQLSGKNDDIRNVVVTGLGGSGFGANLVRELVGQELDVPFVVNKGYSLPAFVGKHSLVIVSSYSGNTEETLAAMADAEKAGATIACISSGGTVAETAKEKGYDLIQIPGGNPPRACLCYSFVQQLYILGHYGLISDQVLNQVNRAAEFLDEQEENIQREAKGVADSIAKKIPIIYSTDQNESIAIRYRQQFNENSKMLCWHHVIPEMNHNELVGWRERKEDWAVVLIRSKNDYSRNQERIEINKSVFEQYSNTMHEIWSKGQNPLQEKLYLILLGDWISYYMAEIRAFDSVEVKVIDFLKGELAKNPL